MAELANGELLKEIYDTLKDVQGDMKAFRAEQESQNISLNRHYEELEKIKWKVLPLVGLITVGIAIVIALIKK